MGKIDPAAAVVEALHADLPGQGLSKPDFDALTKRLASALTALKAKYRANVMNCLIKEAKLLAELLRGQADELADSLQGLIPKADWIHKVALFGRGILPGYLLDIDTVDSYVYQGLPVGVKNALRNDKPMPIYERGGTTLKKPSQMSTEHFRQHIDKRNPGSGWRSATEVLESRKRTGRSRYLQYAGVVPHPDDSTRVVMESIGVGHRAATSFSREELDEFYNKSVQLLNVGKIKNPKRKTRAA